jgi:hypothetical protein
MKDKNIFFFVLRFLTLFALPTLNAFLVSIHKEQFLNYYHILVISGTFKPWLLCQVFT